jgi:hypothetical protein
MQADSGASSARAQQRRVHQHEARLRRDEDLVQRLRLAGARAGGARVAEEG